MKIKDVMTRSVDYVQPSATVCDAADQMAELDVGAVLIGEGDELKGILTDRDIILRVVVQRLNPAEVLVRDVMSSRLFVCSEDDTLDAALDHMKAYQIRRMPVCNGTGAPIGIVTLSDLAKPAESAEFVTEILRDLTEPHRLRGEMRR